MNQLIDSLRRIIADLRASDSDWAVVGGLAVSVRTEPRTTRDVDIAVAVTDDDEAEGLIRHLMRAKYVLEAAVEQTARDRLATARLVPDALVRWRC